MIDRELSYTERQQVKTARAAAEALGLSWKRIVRALSWEQDSPALAEFRAADAPFSAQSWGKITDWQPVTVRKGDWLWAPGLGLVRVETCGAKRASYSVPNLGTLPTSPEELQWGLPIPAAKVPAAEALLAGFYLGAQAVGREIYGLNTVGALQLRLALTKLLEK
jgi:hypothetical protein